MERNIKLLALHNFFTDFVFFAPIAIIYFAKVTGSYTAGMSIFSVAYVSSAVFEIPTGILSDLIGSKRTTVYGTLSSIICVLLYAVGGSYWILFIGALFQGLSRAFYSGNNDALLHDSLNALNKQKDYHMYLGKTSSMFQVALAIASVAGSLMAAISFPLVMWVSVLPQIGAFIVALQLKEPPVLSKENTNIVNHIRSATDQFKQNGKLRLLTIASAIRFSLGESAFFLRSAFVNTLWPLWAVGFSDFLSHVGGAISYYLSGTVINKYSHKTVLWFEILSNRVINLTALLFPTVVSPALMGTTSLTFGAGSVAMNSLQQKEFTQSQRATMGSFISLSGNMMFGIVSVVLGLIADTIGPAKTLVIAHVALLTPLWFYSKIFKKNT